MRGEFDTIADELNLSPDESDRLLQLHDRALKANAAQHAAMVEGWNKAAKAHFGANLPATVSTIRTAIGTDHDGEEFLRQMSWSGLGSNPAVLRVLHRLARRR